MNLQSSKRILIIGSPGSGKSTLTRKLGGMLSLPVIHLDQIYWINNEETLSKEEFDDKLLAILNNHSWIIDGNYSRSLELRIQSADTIIWLDLPRSLCVYRAFKRYIWGIVKKNPYGNPHRLKKGFLPFIWHFNDANRPNMLLLMEKYKKSHQFFQLKTRKEINQILE